MSKKFVAARQMANKHVETLLVLCAVIWGIDLGFLDQLTDLPRFAVHAHGLFVRLVNYARQFDQRRAARPELDPVVAKDEAVGP